MNIHVRIRGTASKTDFLSTSFLFLRVNEGRNWELSYKMPFKINPNYWDSVHEKVKSKSLCDQKLRDSINTGISEIKSYLSRKALEEPEKVNKEWTYNVISQFFHPTKAQGHTQVAKKLLLIDAFNKFLIEHKLSEVRKKNFRVIGRAFQRFESFVRLTQKGKKHFMLYLDDVTPDTLREFWTYMENEHVYYEQYPGIFSQIPEHRTPQPRGKNALIDSFTRIRTFYLWCFKNELTTNRPFDKFPIDQSVYGTPYYITVEERNMVYHTDLTEHPSLAVQRDVFVFQCLVGCRVGDLLKFKKSNIIDGFLEYIPRKTKDGHPVTVRVPLNPMATEIIERYKDSNPKSEALLPYISEQKYNQAIKQIFKIAGLDRMVTVINPTTGDEEKRALCEIASSHLARRTFVGNLYKQVKDQNLVAALSGHKEGSKAFARYREIDDDIRRELVDLIS